MEKYTKTHIIIKVFIRNSKKLLFTKHSPDKTDNRSHQLYELNYFKLH